MTPGRRGWIVVGIFVALHVVAFSARGAPNHTHEGAAGRFYSTWMMPDAPHVSCCDNQDCAPAASRWQGDHWQARWSDTDEWTDVPRWKVEEVRETPDGRSHMCGRRNSLTGELFVFCFVRGGGA